MTNQCCKAWAELRSLKRLVNGKTVSGCQSAKIQKYFSRKQREGKWRLNFTSPFVVSNCAKSLHGMPCSCKSSSVIPRCCATVRIASTTSSVDTCSTGLFVLHNTTKATTTNQKKTIMTTPSLQI